MRIEHRGGKVPAGSLAWLVAIKPRTPIVDRPGGRPANYVVVVVSARDGRLLGDAAGYSPALGHRMGSSWGVGEWA
ncbi:MAG: hypothetical protein WAL63_20610 [Solirubrobacteraceae bacterium]